MISLLLPLVSLVTSSPPRQVPTLPFVRSAFRVKMTMEVDAGRMCRDMQKDSLYLFHVVPWSNDYHRFTSKATIDGKEMEQSTDIERLHRPVYFGIIHPDSGVAKLTYEVTVYEREIGPNDKLPTPVDLSPEDFKRYTDSSWNILAGKSDFDQRMEQEGLKRKDGEKPWDYMVRVASNLREHHVYGIPNNPDWGARWKGTSLFDANELQCNDITVFLGRLARTSGIAYRALPGIYFKNDGTSEYHSRGEFYDRERGWIPVEGAQLIGSGRKKLLAELLGRDETTGDVSAKWLFIPLMDDSGLEVTIKTDGVMGPHFYNEFWQCFCAGEPKKRGGFAVGDKYGHSSFTIEAVPLGTGG